MPPVIKARRPLSGAGGLSMASILVGRPALMSFRPQEDRRPRLYRESRAATLWERRPAAMGPGVLTGAVSNCTTSANPRHSDRINKIYKILFVFNLVNLVNPVKKFWNWSGSRPEP